MGYFYDILANAVSGTWGYFSSSNSTTQPTQEASQIIPTTTWKNLCGFASIAGAINHRIMTSNSLLPQDEIYLVELANHLGLKSLNKASLTTLFNTYGTRQMQEICAPVVRKMLAQLYIEMLNDTQALELQIAAQLDPLLDMLNEHNFESLSAIFSAPQKVDKETQALLEQLAKESGEKVPEAPKDEDIKAAEMLRDNELIQTFRMIPNGEALFTECKKLASRRATRTTTKEKKNLLTNLYTSIGMFDINNRFMSTADNLKTLCESMCFNIDIVGSEKQTFDTEFDTIKLKNSELHWERYTFNDEQIKEGSFKSSALYAQKNSKDRNEFSAAINILRDEVAGTFASIKNLSENSQSFQQANEDMNDFLDNEGIINENGEIEFDQRRFELLFDQKAQAYAQSMDQDCQEEKHQPNKKPRLG